MLSSLDTVLDLGDDTLLWPGEVPLLPPSSPKLCLVPGPSQPLAFLETGKLISWAQRQHSQSSGGGTDTALLPRVNTGCMILKNFVPRY